MKLLITLLILSAANSQASDLFKPIIDNSVTCSTDEIVKILPSEMTDRINTINLAINKIATTLEVNPCLVLSMVWTESTFKAAIKSNKGAEGLMQLMPRTKAAMAYKMDYELNRMFTANLNSGLSYKEIENLIIGTYYTKKLIKKFKGNVKHAIIAYNQGPTWVAIELKNGRTIGNKNQYLNKVNSKMRLVTVNN